MSDNRIDDVQLPVSPSVMSGLMLVGLICGSVGLFYFLGLKFIGLSLDAFFASFLLLWHWTAVEGSKFPRLPHSIVGAMVGLGLACLSGYLPSRFGMPTGMIMALVPLILALFMVIMSWIPICFNSSTMLFVTVLAAPALAKGANYLDLVQAMLCGAAFFALVVYLAGLYVRWQSKPKADASKTASAA